VPVSLGVSAGEMVKATTCPTFSIYSEDAVGTIWGYLLDHSLRIIN